MVGGASSAATSAPGGRQISSPTIKGDRMVVLLVPARVLAFTPVLASRPYQESPARITYVEAHTTTGAGSVVGAAVVGAGAAVVGGTVTAWPWITMAMVVVVEAADGWVSAAASNSTMAAAPPVDGAVTGVRSPREAHTTGATRAPTRTIRPRRRPSRLRVGATPDGPRRGPRCCPPRPEGNWFGHEELL